MNNRSLLIIVIFFILFVADLGLFSIADAAIVAILLSAIFRRLALYILILVGTLQDTPGLAGAWWYVGFVGVGCVVIVHSLLSVAMKSQMRLNMEVSLLLFALTVACYGILISHFSVSWLDLDQSSTRPYPIVGGLILFNIVCAYYSFHLLNLQKSDALLLRLLLLIVMMHAVFVAGVQVLITPAFLSSAVSSVDFEGSGQLATVSSLGFARVTGTYATPNGFALVVVLLLLFWLTTYRQRRVPIIFIVFFALFGVGVSLLSLSKAMLGFSFFCTAAVLFSVGITGVASRLLSFTLLLLSVLLFSDIVFNEAVLDAFRVNALDWDVDTYRNIAWRAVINGFEWNNWLFGTGLSHWPVFFEKSVGFRLSDPHTWVFTYAGTFGVLGFLFFAYVIWSLLYRYMSHPPIGKALALCLGGLLLVKDAVSIPYLLGNTPLTWFIWLLIFYVCSGKLRQPAGREREAILR